VDAALAVLARGGNAVDAAIAAVAVQCVVEFPWCGLGGDLFMLIDHPEHGVFAVNGSGAAPRDGADELPVRRLPRFGPLSVAVPGLVATQQLVSEQLGTLPMRELLAPAAELAAEGFALDDRLAAVISQVGAEHTAGLAGLLGDNGQRPGELFRQPDLARTLTALAEAGSDWFYRGEFAESLDRHMAAHGGLLRRTDLAAHTAEWTKPLCTQYRGAQVYQHPPVSMGVLMLAELAIFEQFRASDYEPGSPQLTELMVRCKMAAFDDLRDALDRDADELTGLLATAAERWPPERLAALRKPERVPLPGGTDTTSLAVRDSDGVTVTAIHSLFNTFGSREVIGGTGVVLNDRLASLRLDDGPGPRFVPGARPAHTLNAFLVKRNGRTIMAAATPGGRGQVQTNFQVLVNHIDFGLDPADAVDRPRWLHGTPRQAVDDGVLHVESHYSAHCLDGLRGGDFSLSVSPPAGDDLFGSVTAVGAGTDGGYAVADYRRGAACGAC
jgi:gamma-glutamyltranspeptidase/glutathione hydrolase